MESALPPDLVSPEWEHEIAEGQKALVRGQGFSSSGPQTARSGQMFRCAV